MGCLNTDSAQALEVLFMESRENELTEQRNVKHETDVLAEGDEVCFELWLVHIETGRYLAPDGRAAVAGPGGTVKPEVFTSREEALRRKDALLERVPWAKAKLVNRRNNSQETFTSPLLGEYTREKRRYLNWKSKSWWGRLFRSAPALKLYRPEQEDAKDPANSRPHP